MPKKFILSIIIFFIAVFFMFGLEELSGGYKDIKLGMTQAQVKDVLKKTVEFNLKREEILSVRLEPDTEIISTEGYGFINFAYFHFSNDKLFQILLKVDENRIGYYTLLKRLTERFGKPVKFDPRSASWENDKVKIIIEKPCTIKYQYLPVWKELVKNDLSADRVVDSIRNKFLDDL